MVPGMCFIASLPKISSTILFHQIFAVYRFCGSLYLFMKFWITSEFKQYVIFITFHPSWYKITFNTLYFWNIYNPLYQTKTKSMNVQHHDLLGLEFSVKLQQNNKLTRVLEAALPIPEGLRDFSLGLLDLLLFYWGYMWGIALQFSEILTK